MESAASKLSQSPSARSKKAALKPLESIRKPPQQHIVVVGNKEKQLDDQTIVRTVDRRDALQEANKPDARAHEKATIKRPLGKRSTLRLLGAAQDPNSPSRRGAQGVKE